VDSSVQGGAQVRMLLKSMEDDTRTTLRMVSAQPGVYLQRLNGADYDLIVVCGDASNYEPAYEQAPRLLKHGGTIVFTDALAMASPHAKGGLTNPADRSPKAVMMRGLLDRIEDDERFVTALTPAGTGLLIAGYR
jgi:predicted O-methyltransferase YrrM